MLNNFYKVLNMPMPFNIYYWWNFGSLLGVCLVVQLISGLFLSFYYCNVSDFSFNSIEHIMRNVNYGWLVRFIHANGASLFFFFIYLHIGRGLFFKSFLNLKLVWFNGVIILFLLFMIAFMGYVLPWGQMSFWGATVITNLLSSLPYVGKTLTLWVWGDFSVGKVTLMRFFSFHFFFSFILIFFVFLHIMFLHEKGSSNPLGVTSNFEKIPFNIYFVWKDLMGLTILLVILLMICLVWPTLFMDPDNFIKSNSLVTPVHIQPEWYFLFAYAILRVIPSKLGGVVALMMSIFMLMLILLINKKFIKIMENKYVYKCIYFFWIVNFIYLTLMGMKVVEEPYIFMSKISSMVYFFFFLIYI